MQFSAVALLLLLGLVLHNAWVAVAAVMAHLYSVGLAGWNEEEDLYGRFGAAWILYRRGVRNWWPRLRPWYGADRSAARLFVAEGCDMCREVGQWFSRRGARHLVIVAAESHPSGALRRITYAPGDGTPESSGVAAVARALEHIHLGWALIGWLLRLPVIGQFAQLLTDASGAEPRQLSSERVQDRS